MRNSGEFGSERINYSPKVERKEWSRGTMESIAREQNNEKNYRKNVEIHGTNSIAREKGLRDRLSASEYSPSKDYPESSLYSYERGYIDEGDRQIWLSIVNGIMTERATEAFLNINDNSNGSEERKRIGTEELKKFLYKIGYNDGIQGIIDFDKLKDEIKTNEAYKNGFFDGLEDKKRLGRGR